MEKLLGRARVHIEHRAEANEVYVFRSSVVRTPEEVVGFTMCVNGEKGSASWMDEIRKNYMKMIQRNVKEEVRSGCDKKYKKNKMLVKRLVRKNKERD